MNYREADPTVDQEIDAFKELTHATRRTRKRALPFFALAAVLGPLGAYLHLNGDWSVFGRDELGNYLIFNLSILIALMAPASIGLVPGIVLYVVLRGRERAAWRARHAALPAELLAEIERRVR